MKIRYDHAHRGLWIFSDRLHRLTARIPGWLLWVCFWVGYTAASIAAAYELSGWVAGWF